MDWQFLMDVLRQLLPGLPLTLELAALSLSMGFVLAVMVAASVGSSFRPLRWFARAHIELFRSTPLLVQKFLIYYGLGQIVPLRHSFLWPYLRSPIGVQFSLWPSTHRLILPKLFEVLCRRCLLVKWKPPAHVACLVFCFESGSSGPLLFVKVCPFMAAKRS
jgi:His/Glu/Gln/Arg/opine family amino acid ABC transporter permease subunit